MYSNLAFSLLRQAFWTDRWSAVTESPLKRRLCLRTPMDAFGIVKPAELKHLG